MISELKYFRKPLSKVSTLVDLLRYRTLHQPDFKVYTFLEDGEVESASLTYQELDRNARAIAAQLQSFLAPGERVLLLYPTGLEFICAFFGCLYAGVVAIPAYPPRSNNRSMERVQAIVEDAQALALLTTKDTLSELKRRFPDEVDWASLQVLTNDNVAVELAQQWQEPVVNSETLAYLQYTSGSTSKPKGAMISHGNVMDNSQHIAVGWETTSDSVLVSWLPHFHDFGLVYAIIQPLYQGFSCVFMAPTSFIQQPIRWLQAISRYKATHSGAPNFAYELCTSKITPEQRATLDLSNWRVAINGAEPIRPETLQNFAQAFAECGFRWSTLRPAYGLAETTLIVSGQRTKEMPLFYTVKASELEKHQIVELSEHAAGGRKLVGCGGMVLDMKVVIVNPTSLTRCLPNQVGEIWVSSKSVAHGYWRRTEETNQTFYAYLKDTGEGPFLRTGDLGLLKDDQIFVTGRIKDLIIIRGGNHYPQDIELTAEQSHPALRPSNTAAFSVDVNGEERLAIAVEVERTYLRHLNVDEVTGAIRNAVLLEHELQAYAVLLLKTGSIPKTSSGKIQRSACRAGFLAGSLNMVGSWNDSQERVQTDVETLAQQVQNRSFGQNKSDEHSSTQTAQTIQAWLVSKIALRLGVNAQDIDVRQPFVHYNLDSMGVVNLTGELENWLECRLSPTLVYDYPTIEALARYVAGESNTSGSHSKIDADPETQREAIAIIGLGCRFPGANDPKAFFKLLRSGVDAITEVPAWRWDLNTLYHPEPGTTGKMSTRWGGFLEQVDQFDPHFFGIAPREAELIDPQQRLLLEVSWEALENAGIAPDKLAGSQTGVFIGISSNDYSQCQIEDFARINAYTSTGTAFSIAANRLSYVLDLHGPSIAVDTACSSSLVAVHLASQSLHNRECNLAIVGGANLILSPQLTITFSQARMMAADGRCKTFDASADGYVRSEGCGIVILKRLSDAVRDKDNILGLIKGSAINQDGRSNGLTAPNGPSQQEVIRRALENAFVAPNEITYVETHGTGTALGDPIEVESLKAVLLTGRSQDQFCTFGSVKANIGHLEAAAGIASLIKVVLCLQNEEILPQLHFNQLNPHISLKDTPFSIPKECQPWPSGLKPRFAGISSFGFGGTNAHVVVGEAPIATTSEPPENYCSGREGKEVPSLHQEASNVERSLHLLTLSAKSENALQELAQNYKDYFQSHPQVCLADACFTANTGRSHFAHRLTVVAEFTEQLQQILSDFANGKPTAGLVNGIAQNSEPRKIAFLFTGQGSQYVGMGHQLYQTQPTFRQTLNYCDEILRPYLKLPLLEVLYPPNGENSPLNETIYTQPALFALEYALCQLWQSWGIIPKVVMGHSLGEYVAATVAGVFSLEDGLKLVAQRALLMQVLPQNGEMVAVFAPEVQVQAAIQPYLQQVSIAAINGSKNIIISGQRQAVRQALTTLESQGVKTIKLPVSHAFHSPLIEPMLAEFEKVARQVNYSCPRIDLISNVTGNFVNAEIATAEYWLTHLRQPVQFAAGMNILAQQEYEVFLEIGPKPTLLGMGRQCLPEKAEVWLPSLRPGYKDWQAMLQSLAELYVRGVPINFSGFDQDYSRHKVMLPTYPFQRQRYWIKTTKDEHRFSVSCQENASTSIINLFNQGKQLTQQLEKVGKLSEEEIKVLPKLLDLLAQQYQQQQTASVIKDWLYQLEWQPKPRDLKTVFKTTNNLASHHWLIFANPDGIGQALAKSLQEQGQSCTLVYAGDAYQKLETGIFCLNPSSPTDFEQLFCEITSKSECFLKGIIHLWSLEATFSDELTISALEQAQRLGCGSVLHLVQGLLKHCQSVLPRLWLVTRGSQPVEPHTRSLALAQAPLWGLGRVVALEYPELWGGMIDLAPETSKDEIAMIIAEMQDSLGEDHLAFRRGQRYVARLVQSQLSISQEVLFQADGTYLITGGLGSLGLKVAEWMVEQGVRHLVLTGRHGASSAQAKAFVTRMEQLGTKVLVIQADVSNQRDMVKVLEDINSFMPSLRGIIHAAGLVAQQAINEIDLNSLESVLRPKVVGTWIIHQLTQKIKLDFFVSFSSIASVWGSKGQAHYAAANHFLDVFAHYRQALGMKTLSVNWGPWTGGGMAVPEAQTWLSRMGVKALPPQQAVISLGLLLGASYIQSTVADVDWTLFKDVYQARGQRSLLKLIGTQLQETIERQSDQKSKILERLEAAKESDKEDILITCIQEEVAQVLGCDPSQLDPQQGFFDMGMDSLMAFELKKRLESGFGSSLPSTLTFESPTIKKLSRYLAQEVLGWKLPKTADAGQLQGKNEKVKALSTVEELTEDEVEVSISQKLAKLELLVKGN